MTVSAKLDSFLLERTLSLDRQNLIINVRKKTKQLNNLLPLCLLLQKTATMATIEMSLSEIDCSS